MAFEIERRFLVKGNDWQALAQGGNHLRQGYLSTSCTEWTTRIRIIAKKKALLTLKKPAKGLVRYEFEYLIPIDDAESLLELTPHKISKTRYELNLTGGHWVIDCFEGPNYPLILAEIEIPTATTILEKPNWCGEEVTGKEQWNNAALAQKPFSEWPLNERTALNKQNSPTVL